MTCQDAKKLIHEYLDGDLSQAEIEQLHQHIDQCPECREDMRSLEQTVTLLQGHSDSKVEAPVNFVDNVMTRLPQKDTKHQLKSWVKGHPFIVAATLFLVLMSSSLFSIWSNGSEQLTVSAPNVEALIIQHEDNKVIVPDGISVPGDMRVRNGNVEVRGEVKGDIIVTEGHVYLSSTAHIVGEVEEIDQFIKWAWHHVTRWIKEAVPNDDEIS
ncbi:zf-HC2 domain-containing protein [Caldalkalibacillus salinus]|uniref:zf-HC2 domain-containing protein n=1 Tax=Caldalkalibacillus salinus TaxID=2803787 RepID=UPI001924C398|nr:zf-HC2 domain-containing protein [Caldalkalibacillus salinus]